jgi:transposase InsO family protein
MGESADGQVLHERIVSLAGQGRRFGYRRIHILLKREGWHINAAAELVAPLRRRKSRHYCLVVLQVKRDRLAKHELNSAISAARQKMG